MALSHHASLSSYHDDDDDDDVTDDNLDNLDDGGDEIEVEFKPFVTSSRQLAMPYSSCQPIITSYCHAIHLWIIIAHKWWCIFCYVHITIYHQRLTNGDATLIMPTYHHIIMPLPHITSVYHHAIIALNVHVFTSFVLASCHHCPNMMIHFLFCTPHNKIWKIAKLYNSYRNSVIYIRIQDYLG